MSDNNDAQKRLFLRRFSTKELLLNGWSKKELDTMFSVFNTISLLVQEGDYLELGCGTGILCKFIYLFSNKKTILHGIDSNFEAIRYARKNNLQFADNFICANYFDYLRQHSYFNRFSTVAIFLNEEDSWINSRKDILAIIERYKKTCFILCSYEENFLVTKKQGILEFFSEVRKRNNMSVVNGTTLVISDDAKVHKLAGKIRKKIDKNTYIHKDDYSKIFIHGFICRKTPYSFHLIDKDEIEHYFVLNENTRFLEAQEMKDGISFEKVISWKGIKRFDKVKVMVAKNGSKAVFGVRKIKE